MSSALLYTILVLSLLGIVSAIILYIASKKFHVYEDPRIEEVEQVLPSANCGGCGFAGCHALAEAIVKSNTLDNKFCPVGGNETMAQVAKIMGFDAQQKASRKALVRCNGTCEFRKKDKLYEGASTCAIAAMNSAGDTGCQFGCLGFGDCCVVCKFDAIHMNTLTGLPEVDDEKCTACGACVKACPKFLIELRRQMPKNRKIYVACRNTEKGAIAKKSCEVACIGCGKCEKACEFGAIEIKNNLAFIDSDKCKLCRKCVSVCPTNSIIEVNFPARKTQELKEEQSVENV